MRNKVTWTVLLASLGATALLSAQQANSPAATNQTNQTAMRMTQHMQMETMAKSMTSMADVCRMMMEKEMRSYPIKLAAIIGVGTLLFAALVLLVVLEVQWIRFWSVRIKTERLKLTEAKPS